MMKARKGFTLVELLVVVAIIVVLLALLVPAMDSALTTAELATCAAKQNQLARLLTVYAVDHHRKFLPGTRDFDAGEHTPWVSAAFMRELQLTAGNSHDPQPVELPSILVDPAFNDYTWGRNTGSYVIGYSYMGGHPLLSWANDGTRGTPRWQSPLGLNNVGSGELVGCMAEWYTPAGGYSFFAHGLNGPGGSKATGYLHYGAPPNDPKDAGMTGLNLSRVDGSTAWRRTEDTLSRWSGCWPNQVAVEWPGRW